MSQIVNEAISLSKSKYLKEIKELNSYELHDVISIAVMSSISENWKSSRNSRIKNRTAFYFSAEFLVGRSIYNNLVSLGIYDKIENDLNSYGVSLKSLEDIEDAALGNGGLGRLAACFMDSLASLGYAAYGCGIRYRYGMFKQEIRDGYQVEVPDNWLADGNPFELRRPEYAKIVKFL